MDAGIDQGKPRILGGLLGPFRYVFTCVGTVQFIACSSRWDFVLRLLRQVM